MKKYSIPHCQHRQVQDLLIKVNELIEADSWNEKEGDGDNCSHLYDAYGIEVNDDGTVYDYMDEVEYPTLILWANATIAAESFEDDYDPGLTKFVGDQ